MKQMICPMKFSALANSNIGINSNLAATDNFLECNTTKCAWYCTYQNGEGECAIHSLPRLFEGLQDIAKEIGIK